MESTTIITSISAILALLIFPGGLALLASGLIYEWIDRKLLAQLQNRAGPRWFQPLADVVKLLAKEEIVPAGVNPYLFIGLPIFGLAGGLTAALYVPLFGVPGSYSFPGDLIVTLYLLSLLTMCMGLAGANSIDRYSVIGATRTLSAARAPSGGRPAGALTEGYAARGCRRRRSGGSSHRRCAGVRPRGPR